MVDQLGCDESVEVVAQPSLDFMAQCERDQSESAGRPTKFDFIFLDGSHSAETVYREAPAALRLLAEGGRFCRTIIIRGLSRSGATGR